MEAGVDGIFTNRAAQLLQFYGRGSALSVAAILKAQGY
jgi:glycerophosphoryl diester phosphodiesterase